MNNKIFGIIKYPNEKPMYYYMDNTLEELQNIVCGYIEVVDLSSDAVMIVNEDGKITNMEPNFTYGKDLIVGPAIILGTHGEDFTDVPISPAELREECPAWFDEALGFGQKAGPSL